MKNNLLYPWMVLFIILIFNLYSSNKYQQNNTRQYTYSSLLNIDMPGENSERGAIKDSDRNKYNRNNVKDKHLPEPPSNNQVEAITIDNYTPILFATAIIMIVYFVSKRKNK